MVTACNKQTTLSGFYCHLCTLHRTIKLLFHVTTAAVDVYVVKDINFSLAKYNKLFVLSYCFQVA